MSKRKPLWDILSDEKKKQCIEQIIAFFLDERDEEIGVVAAEDILDRVMEYTLLDVYNKGVTDTKSLLQEKFADINVDIDMLKKV